MLYDDVTKSELDDERRKDCDDHVQGAFLETWRSRVKEYYGKLLTVEDVSRLDLASL